MPHFPAIHGIFDQCCQRFAVNYYGFTFGAPGRLALPVRHGLRLRRMSGGLGWRASLRGRRVCVQKRKFLYYQVMIEYGLYSDRALVHNRYHVPVSHVNIFPRNRKTLRLIMPYKSGNKKDIDKSDSRGYK